MTGFFLALTRPIGVFVIIPLLWEYFRASKWKLQAVRADVFALLLIPWGLVVFGFYLSQTTGSFFDFVQATAWRREAGNPFIVLARGLAAPNVHLVFGATVAIISLGLVLAFARRIGPCFLILGLYSILIPLSTGLISLRSMPRYALTVLPLYVILSDVGDRDKRVDQALTISLGLLQGFLMAFWTNRSLLVV